jgi:hypothetical protein
MRDRAEAGDGMKRKLALTMLLQAAALLAEAELVEDGLVRSEGASPESGSSIGSGPANDPPAGGPPGKRRKGARGVHRPQGPVDEVSARRADEVLKRAGLLPVTPRKT